MCLMGLAVRETFPLSKSWSNPVFVWQGPVGDRMMVLTLYQILIGTRRVLHWKFSLSGYNIQLNFTIWIRWKCNRHSESFFDKISEKFNILYSDNFERNTILDILWNKPLFFHLEEMVWSSVITMRGLSTDRNTAITTISIMVVLYASRCRLLSRLPLQ